MNEENLAVVVIKKNNSPFVIKAFAYNYQQQVDCKKQRLQRIYQGPAPVGLLINKLI